jgi:nitroreductase
MSSGMKKILTLFTFKTRDMYLRLKHVISVKKRGNLGKEGGNTRMDVFTAIRQRSSVRAYKAIDVEEDKLMKVLESARLSPSASNRQGWKFIVVKNKETKKKLAKAAFGQSFIGEAPVVIVACGTDSNAMMACGQPTHTVNVSIACSFMILQAYEVGLGTCWIGAFKEDQTRKILSIPEHVRVVAMIPMGYPDQPPLQKFRKSLNQIICYEKYE